MNSPLLRKAAQYILKDTGEANESPKLIVVIRILLLSMLFYIVVNSIIYISILNNIGIVIFLISLLIFLLLFGMTYRYKTTTVVYTLNLCMAAWIIVNIFYFGWDTGVQHFIIVLLVLSFFQVTHNTAQKPFTQWFFVFFVLLCFIYAAAKSRSYLCPTL